MISPTVSRLLAEVAECYRVEPDEVYPGRSRDRAVSRARAELCWRLRAHGWSQNRIAVKLRMHHTSVRAAVARAEREIERRNHEA